MSDNSESIQRFMSITGGTETQAKHMLDASGGKVDAAIQLFYDTGNTPGAASAPQGDTKDDEGRKARIEKKEPAPPKPAGGKPPEELYVGSGQAVVYNDDLMKAAKQHGAVSNEEDAKRGTSSKFTGAARVLGMPTSSDPTASGTGGPKVAPSEVEVRVTLYKNGFVVDEGDLRDKAAPEENKQFLTELFEKGLVPREINKQLKARYPNQPLPEVKFVLEDKASVDFVASFKAFKGEGRSMGAGSSDGAISVSAAVDGRELTVDESQPTTTLQLALPNGKRVPAKFNLTHTVKDVVAFVKQSQPDVPAFTLSTSFPRKKLTDLSATIQSAGLTRAVLIVETS
ncbi:NSFL1 cofactor p47-like protein [Diplonema papillatum]|nr:NSFL1 cofactor p47-like protein [Diplonema papillatum]